MSDVPAAVQMDMEMQFIHEAVENGVSKVLIVSAFFRVEDGQGSPPFIRELVTAIPSLSANPVQIVSSIFSLFQAQSFTRELVTVLFRCQAVIFGRWYFCRRQLTVV